MSLRITARYNSAPTRIMPPLVDGLGVAVDITDYAFRLIVKRDLDLPDDEAFFDLDGVIVTAADGTYSFAFTEKETCIAVGIWPGEIRYWDDGDDTKPPTDSIAVDFDLTEAVDLP